MVGLLVVDLGKHGRQFLDRLVSVDDAARFGKQRRGLDVGRQHLAVAVDDVRPGSGHPALRAARHVGILQAEIDQSAGNRRIDGEEHRHGHDDAGLGLTAGRLAGGVDDDRAVLCHLLSTFQQVTDPWKPADH